MTASEQDRKQVNDAAERIARPSQEAREAAALRLDQLTKPQGSLGRLEQALIAAAGMQRLAIPRFDRAHIVIMAGDHGVAEEGVSAYPSAVTAQMVHNFLQGGAAVCALARQVGAQVHVVDMGVASEVAHPLLLARNVRRGTRNFARMEALTTDEVWRALAIGVELGEALAMGGGRVLALGEMGIGNTTVSAALLAALTGLPAAELTGYGTGVDEAGRLRKAEVITAALRKHRPDARNPIDLLRKFGGLEIAGLAGVALGAAAQQAVIVADGLISTVALVLATIIEPRVGQYVLAGHQSAEPGHVIALQRLGCTPLLDLGLRLGEASGAVLALAMLQGAERTMREMATFAEASVATAEETTAAGETATGATVENAVPVGTIGKVASPIGEGMPGAMGARQGVALAKVEATPRDEVSVSRADASAAVSTAFYRSTPEPGLTYAEQDLTFTESERAAVYKAIYLRRDIRKFLPNELPADAVARILDAGHHGPSVGFMQPWNFILIADLTTKRALRDVVETERQAAALHFHDQRRELYTRLKVEGLLEAPLTVCVTSDPSRGGAHVLGRNSIPETDLFSVSCAIENMWLAARAENIALGWVSIFKKSDVRAILAIPHHVEPVGLLSLGYTEQWPQRPLLQTAGWRERVPVQEVLYQERWGVTAR